MAYIAYISRSFDAVIVEAPRNEKWVAAIRAVVPRNQRKQHRHVWQFNQAWYIPVREICKEYFIKVSDAFHYADDENHPEPNGWREALAEHQAQEGIARDTRIDTDNHAILFVTGSAPIEVIKASYRALSKIHHPDAGGDPEEFKRINAAYHALTGEKE